MRATRSSASANARAVGGRDGGAAVSIDAANTMTIDVVVASAEGRAIRRRRWRRMRAAASWASSPSANGCSPVTISYSTTQSDQTSSAASAGRPDSTSGDR